jgi:hypothetical protein
MIASEVGNIIYFYVNKTKHVKRAFQQLMTWKCKYGETS